MNKHIPTIILAVAVVVLYVLHFTQSAPQVSAPASTVATSDSGATISGDFPVAYVNLDSLLASYDLYNSLKGEHEAKYKASEAKFQKQAEQLQKDIYQYQESAQKGLITRAQAETKEQELTMRQQELMQLEQTLSQDLMKKEEMMQKRIYDSIKVVLNDFNADKQYRLILNNAFSSALLDADETLNITDTVLSLLNNKPVK